MSFEAKDYPISDILNKVVFDIPRNQRRYVWKKSSWQDLFEDVLFSITEEKPHFIGSIVLKKGSKKDGLSYYTIIDGQQRLTTITLFLVAIMKHFHENDIAYVMAKHADANIPDTPEEWLDGFNTFSIYQVLPQLIELWGLNVQTDVSAKKTSSNRSLDDNTFIFASLRTDGD